MKRGKRPPIEVRIGLTKSERLHKLVFKTKVKPAMDPGSQKWIETNCFNCEFRNAEWIATAVLNDEPLPWKHICCYPGKTFILPEEHTCGCFKIAREFSEILKLPEKLP